MEFLTSYEQIWLKTLEDLRESPAITVRSESIEPVDVEFGDPGTAAEEIAEDFGVNLSGVLERCYLRFTGLGSHWATTGRFPRIAGEFHIASLQRQLEEIPPELAWSDPSAEERQLLSELYAIDGTPESGVGSLTALRMKRGTSNPEVWFDDGGYRAWKMDIDYCEYLETLRVTKGTFGWQYLYIDVHLRGDEYEATAARLGNMLWVFADLFPGYDYTSLQGRLAERL
ncbi:hypothetical protein [Streptomyces sp. DASNCL29]|uniref:hypothetical protein n=1 Tax=Streptomyces sp. DASNCL29 TaxID=2583819 RepID=UPI00110F9425|nr:hypothetical protein [Streptomyces sp. DASNCL29]TMU99250.1 hypothetical protein FGK60_16855 [Streptomyces sp. DASNCL29]